MKLFQGIMKVALSPLMGAAEVVRDIGGSNSDEEQGISILTLGASSIIKGTAKGIISGVEDIFD